MDYETFLFYQTIVSGVSSFVGTYLACRYMTHSFEQVLQKHREQMEPLFLKLERSIEELSRHLEAYPVVRAELPENQPHVIDAEYRTIDTILLPSKFEE